MDAVTRQCHRLQLPALGVTLVSILTGGLIIASGIIGLVFFDLLRLAINAMLLPLGMLVILADVRAFWFFGYAKFFYVPLGRGLYFVVLGLVVLHKSLIDVILGSCIICLGFIYTVASTLNGGVPRPLTQRSVEDLPLAVNLRFVGTEMV